MVTLASGLSERKERDRGAALESPDGGRRTGSGWCGWNMREGGRGLRPQLSVAARSLLHPAESQKERE